jgi:hypothetical protein
MPEMPNFQGLEFADLQFRVSRNKQKMLRVMRLPRSTMWIIYISNQVVPNLCVIYIYSELFIGDNQSLSWDVKTAFFIIQKWNSLPSISHTFPISTVEDGWPAVFRYTTRSSEANRSAWIKNTCELGQFQLGLLSFLACGTLWTWEMRHTLSLYTQRSHAKICGYEPWRSY